MSRSVPRSRLRLAALAVLVVTVLAVPPAAHAALSTVADYRARVGKALDAVASAKAHAADRAKVLAVADEVRVLLPESERVKDGTRTVEVADPAVPSLLGELETAGSTQDRTDALGALERHLTTLRAAVGEPGAPAPSDPAALARLLAEVRPDAASSGDSYVQSLLERITEAIGKWLSGLSATPEGATRMRAAWFAVAIVFAGLAVWVAVRAARYWRRSVAKRERVRAAGADAPIVAEAEGLPEDAAAFAERLAGEGRYRDAVRALFGDAARSLGERGLLARTRTRTNAELLAEIRVAAPSLASPMSALSDAFEVAWYGHRDPGAGGYRSVRELHASVLAAVAGAGGDVS